MSDERYELREGWVWAKIEDTVQPVGQFNPSATPEAVYRYVDVSSISNERFEIETPKVISGATAPTRARQAIRPGDVLFSTVRPYLRNVALVRKHTDGDVGSTAFCVLRSNGSVEPKYLFQWTLTKEFSESLVPKQRGISYPAVRDADVLAQAIPLAPLAEQKRIMAKIEALFGQSRTARQALERISPLLKRFRQSVLAAAFRGDLTRDWRETQADLEPAAELLARLIADRGRKREVARLSSLGTKRRTREEAGKKEFEEPVKPEAELKGLPQGWVWASGAQLFDWASGKFLPKKRQRNGPIPVFGGNGIVGYHDKALVAFPTVVIGRVGALCGNAFMTEGTAWVTDNAIYASYVPSQISLRYCQLVFSHADLNTVATGSGQPFVSQTMLDQVPVPLPPFAEQCEIVRRLESLFKLTDMIEAAVRTAWRRTDKIDQAILARSFRGELVLQDPNDEPASVLLDRICRGRCRNGPTGGYTTIAETLR